MDYVIWTGDLVPHDVWNQTNDQLMEIIEESIELVYDKLPGVPIFPAVGNHERSPVNWYLQFFNNFLELMRFSLKEIIHYFHSNCVNFFFY